ncbi:MAG: energy-coupling factor transporter transmembrane component T [Halobacteriota archaeon]
MFAHDALDPRSKLALTVAVIVVAVAARTWLPLVGLLAFVLGFVALGRGYGPVAWVRSIGPILYLLPVLLVLNTLFYAGGESIWTVPVAGYTVGVTTDGVATSGLIALRLLVIAGVAAWFAATTDAERFEAGLVHLGIPWSMAFLLSLSMRLVPTMRHRFTVIEEAQRSRGLTLDGGVVDDARDRIPMFVPFLSAIIRYGYELSDALTARGFDRIDRRTSLVDVEHGSADYLVYLLAIGVVLVGLFATTVT